MPIISDKFKKQVLDDLFDDFRDSDNVRYYAAIGRAEDWNDSDIPAVPTNSFADVRTARNSIYWSLAFTRECIKFPGINWW